MWRGNRILPSPSDGQPQEADVDVESKIKTLKPGKWIVLAGSVVGVGTFTIQFARGDSFYRALIEAISADFGTMIVGGVKKRFLQGDDVSDAKAGLAGAEVTFAQATETPIQALNERLDSQLGTLEERVFELEKEREEDDDGERARESGPPE